MFSTLRAMLSLAVIFVGPLAVFADDEHWAFRAPKRPELPAVKNAAWVRNPIDRFILARLEKEGLRPSAEADRVTLLRRLSLDLIGLPPSVKEVDDFLADKSDKAYEKVVDRLLASPHYGERWGRLWLDAARYADSDGFEKDKPRFVWAYRDWVINTINSDLHYDKFIIDQIAGDLLPNATPDQIAATGYLRNSMINEEGGVDPEQFRMEAMYDRMDAIGKGILGLTIQCAQCHNHKFDPLTQAEYYKLFAFLNNTTEGSVAVYTPQEQMKRADLFRQIHEIEADLKHREPKWPDLMRAWERQVKDDQPDWKIVRPQLDASGDEKYVLQPDGSVLAGGYAPTKHSPEFTGKTDLKKVTAVRLELLNDGNLPLNGPGRSIKGLFALTEFRVIVTPNDNPAGRREVKIIRATADVNPPVKELDAAFDDRSKRRRVTGPIEYVIDGKDETAWTTDIGPGRSNVPRKAVFVFEEPIDLPNGGTLTFRVTLNHGGWNSDDNQNNNLGRFRFSATDEPNAVADPVPANVRAFFAIPGDKRTPAQIDAVFSYWRTTMSEWKEANAKIEALRQQHPEGTSQLVLYKALAETGRAARHTSWKAGGAFPSSQVRAVVHARVCQNSCTRCRKMSRRRGWRLRNGWWPAIRRRPPGHWSTASGKRISAPASWRRRRTSAPRPTCRRTQSCSTGLRSSSMEKELEPQGTAQADRDVGDLSASASKVTPELLRTRPARTSASCAGVARASVPTPRRCAMWRWRRAACLTTRSADRAFFRRCPVSCCCRRPATAPKRGRNRRAPTATVGHCTRSASGRCRIPRYRRSTRPMAISPVSAAVARTRRCKH